jgi:hypothetical protein
VTRRFSSPMLGRAEELRCGANVRHVGIYLN